MLKCVDDFPLRPSGYERLKAAYGIAVFCPLATSAVSRAVTKKMTSSIVILLFAEV